MLSLFLLALSTVLIKKSITFFYGLVDHGNDVIKCSTLKWIHGPLSLLQSKFSDNFGKVIAQNIKSCLKGENVARNIPSCPKVV